MRLSDLMKMRSVDSSGEPLDHVKDVRLEETAGGWVVTDVVVGRAAVAERLGFMHGVVERPRVLAWLMGRVARRARVVPWDKVRLDSEHRILQIAARSDELPHPEANG